MSFFRRSCWLGWMAWSLAGMAGEVPVVKVESQPLASQIRRLLLGLDQLGMPLDEAAMTDLAQQLRLPDAAELQRTLDARISAVVTVAPSGLTLEGAEQFVDLQQAGYSPVLIKVLNRAGSTDRWQIRSPQGGLAFRGQHDLSMERQQTPALRDDRATQSLAERWLALEPCSEPPLTRQLSGLEVEYVVALFAADRSGEHAFVLEFGLASGTNADEFSWAVTPLRARVRPARNVRLKVGDEHEQPTTARLTFRDMQGRVFPPQARRLAPDFFFQTQVYRGDGETVLLPPGKYHVETGRGPECRVERSELTVPAEGEVEFPVTLKRWIDPARYGFFSGDHHIHAAGCSHYTSPTEGVTPADMFRQIQGEGLNVGCVLTWGPCFDAQRRFFGPTINGLSTPRTLLKYDLEISGFGSQALGHVCLLNLQDQEYPGAGGTSIRGWPTWTTPVLRWAKEQGAVTGFAHSASGLTIDPSREAERLIAARDANRDGVLSRTEAESGVLPETFAQIDLGQDDLLQAFELVGSLKRAATQLPNYAIPEMNGVGAMEICVATSEGVCDFISSMDTERTQEWNTWYHLLNCGFPLKTSGETDFPCMSSLQVGQGRVYVQLGDVAQIDFTDWCRGLAAGQSYVSDGYAHALQFTVAGVAPGPEPVRLTAPGPCRITARVAFALETPVGVAHGTAPPPDERPVTGDTRVLHGPRRHEFVKGGMRTVELIVNGLVQHSWSVAADGREHELEVQLPLSTSCWVALRSFPQLHTNPVTVLLNDQPVRASRRSAQWCAEMTEVLWQNREQAIVPTEREAARAAFDRTIQRFRQIASESAEGS